MTRSDWGAVSKGWEASADALRRATMPVASWMIDHTAPQVGQTVLELAAGIGDTGFLAAELVQPGGTLISSDFVARDALRRPAARRGARDQERALQADRRLAADRRRGREHRRRALPLGLHAAWTTPRTRCRRRGASCGPAAASRSPPGRAPTTTAGARCRSMLLDGATSIDPTEPGGQFAWAREGRSSPSTSRTRASSSSRSRPSTSRSATRRWTPGGQHAARWASRAGARAGVDRRADELLARARDAAARVDDDDGSLAIPARTWVAAADGITCPRPCSTTTTPI